MLDQKIDELSAIDKADARKACLEGDVRRVSLKIASCYECALPTERYGLPKLPDRSVRDFCAVLVTFA